MFRFRWIRSLFQHPPRANQGKTRLKPPRRRTRLEVEELEARTLLSTYVVNIATDNAVANYGVQGPNVNDNPAGDLRYCVSNAQSGDKIIFGLPGSATIYLSAPLTINNKNITIEGTPVPNSYPLYTIDGDSASRLFTITGNSTVEIDDLTLQNGKTSANDPYNGAGGAIYDTGSGLKLVGDVFLNDTAAGNGGAIAANLAGAPLNVNNCDFSGDISKGSGGAIYAGGPTNVILTQATFQTNRSAGYGGAVDATGNPSATLQVSSCTFTNNGTNGNSGLGADGGAIFTTDTEAVTVASNGQNVLVPTITYSTFTDNNANAGSGGAIAYEPTNGASNFGLSYSTLTNNQSVDGGGAYVNVSAVGVKVQEIIYACLFNNNQAFGTNASGGGLDVRQQTFGSGSARLDLFNSTFYQNRANAGSGGGIGLYANSDAEGNNTNLFLLTSLTATQNSASDQGGGLFVDPGSQFTQADPGPYLQNNIFAGNMIQNSDDNGPDIFGSVISTSANLISNGGGATAIGGWKTTKQMGPDQVGTSAVPIDPQLDPNGPQNNGGPTQTIKIPKSGPAYRKGNWFVEVNRQPQQIYDQRGALRPNGNNMESIGAYDPDATGLPASGMGSLSGQGTSVAFLTGTPPQTVALGTFTDVSGNTDPSQYSLTIDWDNGQVTSGTLSSMGNGQFTIYGTMSYAEDGNYPVEITILNLDDGFELNLNSTAEVTSAPASIYLTSSANPAIANQPLTLNAGVSGDYGTPTGSVTFLTGNTVIGTASVVNGTATLTTATLPLGDQTITANYSGDATYNSSTETLDQTVAYATPSVYLSSSANPALVNQPLTLNLNVSGDYGAPTGTVTFLNGNNVIGIAAVVNGNATLTTSTLPVGNLNIQAVYSGDATYANTTATMSETVQQGVAYLYLSSNNSSSQAGQTVTFNANVSCESSGGPTPTGTVTFYDGSTPICTVNIDGSGNASLSVSGLSIGDHNISAVYSGDATFGGTSGSMTQTVNANYAYMWLYSSNESSQAGAAVTFTANLNGGNYGTPTGSVNFYDGSTFLGSGTLDGNGNATFTTSSLSVGSHSITAEYDGDNLFGSSSGSMTQTVS